jgi:acetyltransferase-like isoleucine patch superfamily enzyme
VSAPVSAPGGSALRGAVERLVGRLKGDPAYRLRGDYTDRQLLIVLWHRGRQALRGLPLRARLGVPGLVLRGRRVTVEHAGQLTAGAGLILEDDVRVSALSRDGIALGRSVTIARGATLTCTGALAELGAGIAIGDRSAVGAGAFLGGQGGIAIGDDVIAGPGVRIFSEDHAFDALDRPIRAQGTRRARVTIESDCWLGAGVTVVAGVTIGRGCVIAAGAVVTRDVPPYSVAAGVPARAIRSRVPAVIPAEAAIPPVVGRERSRVPPG